MRLFTCPNGYATRERSPIRHVCTSLAADRRPSVVFVHLRIKLTHVRTYSRSSACGGIFAVVVDDVGDELNKCFACVGYDFAFVCVLTRCVCLWMECAHMIEYDCVSGLPPDASKRFVRFMRKCAVNQLERTTQATDCDGMRWRRRRNACKGSMR